MNAPGSPLARDLAATLDWWRDAGVDLDFVDDATAWLRDDALAQAAEDEEQPPQRTHRDLAKAPQEEPAFSAPKVDRINLLGDSPPASLDAFHQFWLEAPGLDGIGPRGRIAPRGVERADLMVLVVDPEERDRDTLLSGPQGELLANILRAMGLTGDHSYIASALPRHTPMADTEAIAHSGMDAVLALHIKLAKPKRIVAFGANILPLLGHDRAQDIISLREINHDGATTPLLVSEGLDSLMSMPRLKARFWRRCMEWSA